MKKDDPTEFMKLSGRRWLALIVFDVSIKAAYFFVFSLNIFAIPYAIYRSVLHLCSFVLARFLVRAKKNFARYDVALTLALTNFFFVILTTYLWISSIRKGDTECVGTVCNWINGNITSTGETVILVKTLIYILLNLATFLMMKLALKAPVFSDSAIDPHEDAES